ncbi:E3 ubiquitin-protein ligase TRAIP-like isoform X1 [Rhopalosiphum maidis]|uniref:E3 ubiquitin-protein ligase TRAIP-like isoform X1 n=1 Tax=Rhopalosiphum maidis TaxID=43146 RepID=UPI000EFDCD71|nr:E3 ubiquitin-protein ligase TRAIP-like isoform X1 [Rhopalosiphum maidis]
MLASCSICGDCFTGIHPESVHSTPCGHVFHYECLMTWIKRSQTCPHCRSKVTEKQIIKLYFHNNSNLSIKEDISSLTHQVQSLTYENTLKNEEIKNLLIITKKEKEQLISLKKHVKDVEDKIRGHQTFVSSLQENIRFLKSECKKSTSYKLEAEELKKDLEKYQSINSILYGTPADSQEAVCLLKKKTDIQTLCLLITSFKKEIQTLKDSNKDLETKFSQRVTKYMELKRHLCNINAKESMNTRVMEKLKSEITDLEAEIVRLQKKCANLESLVQANDNTPRRTELCKRIIHESPAPELTVTPSLEKVYKGIKTNIYSPENSVSSTVQPKGQLKPHSLNNKTEQSSSQSVNTFMPKSPRRLIGFMRPPLTTKSVSANYVSKSMTFSSSSDEEMYDGLGGRSKPDVYPSRQKPIIKKRKLVSNFKKKPPPSNSNTTLDSFLSAEIL